MNLEDYNKYYIQGSDHYLIPKDVFKELFNEMINWKEESQRQKEVIDKLKDKTKENIENAKYEITTLTIGDKAYYQYIVEENKQLQEELECTIGIVEHNRIISEKNKEINQLKDNWNKLKKYINEANEDLYWTNNYDDILYVMQELEGSDSNDSN